MSHRFGLDLTPPHPIDDTDENIRWLIENFIKVAPEQTFVEVADFTVSPGTLTSGTADDLAAFGGTDVVITEVTGAPGWTVEADFTIGLAFNQKFQVYAAYVGNATHVINIDLWNILTSSWDTFVADGFDSGAGKTWHSIDIPPIEGVYISSEREVKARINHVSNGVGTHTFTIEYLVLQRN